MKILVNGAWHETQREELGYGGSVVSTAVNGEFIAAALRARTSLAEGDRVEVLAPMQGG